LLDSIDKLSNRPDFLWCELSRPRLAEFIGVDTRTIQRAVKKFLDEGLIEINSDTDYLRTTTKWHELVNVNGDKMSPPPRQNVTPTGDKMSPLYIYKDNNKDIETREETSLVPSFEEYLEETRVTTDYEDWGDDGVSNLVYRRDGKKISEKKLQQEYRALYQTPRETPVKAPRTQVKFNHDTFIMELKNSSQKVNKIIAMVWAERGYHFDNYEQWHARMGQDVKYARQLEGYTPSQVREVIDICNREEKELNYKWSMSTLAKKIANVVL